MVVYSTLPANISPVVSCTCRKVNSLPRHPFYPCIAGEITTPPLPFSSKYLPFARDSRHACELFHPEGNVVHRCHALEQMLVITPEMLSDRFCANKRERIDPSLAEEPRLPLSFMPLYIIFLELGAGMSRENAITIRNPLPIFLAFLFFPEDCGDFFTELQVSPSILLSVQANVTCSLTKIATYLSSMGGRRASLPSTKSGLSPTLLITPTPTFSNSKRKKNRKCIPPILRPPY